MAFLILADGTVFEGKSIGACGSTIGETVFTTGMTGYLETLTDPSYFGQIVTQTFPLIGNYGVISEDFESAKSWVRGYVVREMCRLPSNFRCQDDLSSYLKSQNVIGICGIDTRALTKKLREAGVMNGMIVSDEVCPKVDDALLAKINAYRVEESVETVSCKVQFDMNNGDRPQNNDARNPVLIHEEWQRAVESKQAQNLVPARRVLCKSRKPAPKIVLWDFGAKYNIGRELVKRGAEVVVVPYSYTAEQILALNPDGLMLSNGPGDPADNAGVISEINRLCRHSLESLNNGDRPLCIFGICLGHQMLALARGAKTTKLKYGHRGGNHPVKDMETGRIYISSQNHGYAVENDSLPSYAKLAFTNSNDGTCEGISYTDIPAFSVQFHPEACGGPHDTNFLFDRFIGLIEKNKCPAE